MDKIHDLGDTIDLGAATIETLGDKQGGREISSLNAHSGMGLSDND